MKSQKNINQLTDIPGVGKSIANDLQNIGIKSLNDLIGKDPEQLYNSSNKYAGKVQDRCLLYVFRTAVYYVNTDKKKHKPEKLKWWNWKDSPRLGNRGSCLGKFPTLC
ncbi:pathogenicity locus [candidate division WOR-1 bacterium RIFOXYD2_FULL_36_8]|uniref:Pathogenicity locus n=1 Tax=candidate division WOR-1 bacterium RIFOXYB2_FULL_36_35 TaxID=1802578 RepID=A0A1F4RZG2_UNCSA|nr:MAG: pathogenicity locus [candidate division WOR-1 bacterium RIFOXYB2_FULL_36_35]OGC16494.1 MAG: pathogenicity locus [candidate division WOR-1 bacterium RIFOXYA12_FULL_36_13]OGC37551.1 MAG: pathogenicity locus [candidate division WOR-1 bacterium RIFOXYD2_FULL_36_8]